MTNTVATPTEHCSDPYFGVCPICRTADGYANVGRSHWFFCQEHQKKWCAGSNIFSDWRQETEEEQRKQYESIGLGRFEEAVAYYGNPTGSDADENHVATLDRDAPEPMPF
jgi:hypothetical protein